VARDFATKPVNVFLSMTEAVSAGYCMGHYWQGGPGRGSRLLSEEFAEKRWDQF